jgi:acyl dehydratase
MVGQEIAVSEWLEVTQTMINGFADATGDHQWIHVDEARARAESPFGTTIAHGFLTLSLMVKMLSESISFRQLPRMGLNYGLNRVRFTSPVPSGSLIRSRFAVKAVEEIPGGFQITWSVIVELKGSEKPCCVAEWLGRRYD